MFNSAFASSLSPKCKLSADQLNAFLALSPADNLSKRADTQNWLSNLSGQILKNWINFSEVQSQVWAPFGLPKDWFFGWTKPLVKETQKAVAAGQDPDPVANDNMRIETEYAERIKNLVTSICQVSPASASEQAQKLDNIDIQGNRYSIDHNACEQLCTSSAGKLWLAQQLQQFQLLEWQYHSFGQTRLKALKKLLRSALQVIAGEVFSELSKNPYRKLSEQGQRLQSDAEYLAECEQRLLALLAQDAFDMRRFAQTSPYAVMGASKWETVPGSELFSVQLRYYPRPEGVKANGRTLYLASPMINRCELFDLAAGKSVIEGMLQQGYDLYMVDYGNPGGEQSEFDLSFYGQTVHDHCLKLIQERHPEQNIDVMAYCMGGTLFLPYLARHIEELKLENKPLKIRQLVLMTTPVYFDDQTSGHKPMRDVIRNDYSASIMSTFYSGSNVPPQAIEVGMNTIQPGVGFSVTEGFYARANFPGAIIDAAPFLNWLSSGTRFPAKAHRQWIQKVFIDNEIWEGKFTLPSKHPELDGQPVNLESLTLADVAIFDYRGLRDPIAPAGSCRTSERWGRKEDNHQLTCGGLNRTIEKNIGHIFVVSKKLLAEFLEAVSEFLQDQPPAYNADKDPEVLELCPPPRQAEEAKAQAPAAKPSVAVKSVTNPAPEASKTLDLVFDEPSAAKAESQKASKAKKAPKATAKVTKAAKPKAARLTNKPTAAKE